MSRTIARRIDVLLWAHEGMARQMAAERADPERGWCYGCDAQKLDSQCRQAERDETCVYVCRTCGQIIDQSPPF